MSILKAFDKLGLSRSRSRKSRAILLVSSTVICTFGIATTLAQDATRSRGGKVHSQAGGGRGGSLNPAGFGQPSRIANRRVEKVEDDPRIPNVTSGGGGEVDVTSGGGGEVKDEQTISTVSDGGRELSLVPASGTSGQAAHGTAPQSPVRMCSPTGSASLISPPTPCAMTVAARKEVGLQASFTITCSGTGINHCDVTITLTDKNTSTGKIEVTIFKRIRINRRTLDAVYDLNTTLNPRAGDHVVTATATDDDHNATAFATESCYYVAQ